MADVEIAGDFDNLFGSPSDRIRRKNTTTFPMPSQSAPLPPRSEELVSPQVTEAISKQIEENTPLPEPTILRIDKEILGSAEDVDVPLSTQDVIRQNTRGILGLKFVRMTDGTIWTPTDKLKIYNGSVLYNMVQETTSERIMFPRSAFLGQNKEFLLEFIYINQLLEDAKETFYKHSNDIYKILANPETQLTVTKDNGVLEFVLPSPAPLGRTKTLPNGTMLDFSYAMDFGYKMIHIHKLIMFNNAIVSILLTDYWV